MKYTNVILLLCSTTFGPLYAAESTKQNSASTESQSQIGALDTQIQQLKNQRDVAAMRAYVAGNTADQVMEHDWLGYRTALDRQAQFEAEVADLDAKIAELEKQKAALMAKTK